MAPEHPLSPGGTTYAILDANVMLPARLSDVLFDLHAVGLYFPRWTRHIEREFMDHWFAVCNGLRKSVRTALKNSRTTGFQREGAERRLNCFKAAVGIEYEVLGYETAEVIGKVPARVDRGDTHVVAAAMVVKGLCEKFEPKSKVFIVSSNTAHLAVNEVGAAGIEVVKPGRFIDKLCVADSVRVGKALELTANDLNYPPYTKDQLLGILDLHGASATVKHFNRLWSEKSAD
jgi:hypothetical protein